MLKRIQMAKALLIASFTLLSSVVTAVPVPEGDWHGLLDVKAAKLRLWIEVKRNEQGELTATLDSIDQSPGRKIPITDFSVVSNEMSFFIPMISAKYKGTWDENKKQWQGKFSQGNTFPLNLTTGKPEKTPQYSNLVGVWKTEIKGNPLLITIKTNPFGTNASLASPNEGVSNLPIENVKLTDQSVSFQIPYAGVKFKGKLSEDKSSFTGKWRQQGQPRRTLTFTLDKAPTVTEVKRPQHPSKDVDYVVEQVSFDNPNANGVSLSGTLTLPEGKGPFAAAILISGSGPQDRDETFMGHKPFAVIADHLTKQGIAVLRYDDRGVAKSTGDHNTATSWDFATDANAAHQYLATHPKINNKAIGMIGHSEGGLIAPLAKDMNDNIAFLVMLAGPGINTIDLMLSQQEAMTKLQGLSEQEIANMQSASKDIMVALKQTTTPEQAEQEVNRLLTAERLAQLRVPVEQKERVALPFLRPWYQYFVKYDPQHYFNDKALPILALFGELDVQVTGKENYQGLVSVLADHQDKEIMLLPNMNHMFQEATTGAMSEYRKIEQTMSPKVLALMSNWINKRF